MDLKISILFLFCIIVSINLTNGQVIPTSPPVPVPQYTQCTQFAKGNEYWFTWSGHDYCYRFSSYTGDGGTYAGTWQDGVDVCRSQKSSLVSIHDYNTNYILSHPLAMPSNSYQGYFWIGMSSINSTSRKYYKWSDGTGTDYSGNISTIDPNTNRKIDPNDMSLGRCMTMYIYPQNSYYFKYYKDKIGLWYRMDCGNRAYFICRRSTDPNATPAPPPTITPGGCPDGWYKYADQKCIKYFPNVGNFTQAQKTCAQTPGADMLSIHSQKEQDFVSILTYGQPSPYIGLNRNYYYYQWKWDDQSKTDFTNFGVQEGTTQLYYWNCATVVTNMSQPGRWLKTNCSDMHPVLCQIPNQNPQIKTGLILANNKCKLSGFGNYIQFRNSCYSVVDDPSSKVGFTDAEAACKKAGAHLVSIVDAYEESFLRYYLLQNGKAIKYWIGLQAKVESETDTVANASQVFEWTDDWPIYYTNWGPEEPKTLDEPQDQCVYMGRESGNWITSQCDISMGYVCKASADKPPVTGDRNGYCPTLEGNTDPSINWVNLHKGTPFCYYFSTERKGIKGVAGVYDFSGAKFQCLRRNGTLVSIHSPHQMSLLVSRLSKVPNFISWIGLSRNPSGDFEWQDSTPVDFLNGLPIDDLANMTDLNNDDGILCATLKYDNTWQWASCMGLTKHYYVCQTPKLFSSSSSGGGNGGKTAGIVIGVLLAIAVVVGAVYYIRRNNIQMPALPSFDNPLSRNRGPIDTGIKSQKFDNNSPNNLTNGTHENPFKDEEHSHE